MKQVPQGKFCSSCQKTVVDFSVLSNRQIIGIISSSQNICARMEPYQLNQLNILQTSQLHQFWKKLGFTATIIAVLTVNKAGATSTAKPETQQLSSPLQKSNTASIDSNIVYQTIKGKIIDANDKLVLRGVAITIKGTHISTATNNDGEFILTVPVMSTTAILISYIGYKSVEIKPDFSTLQEYTFKLTAYPTLMGEVVVVKRASRFKLLYYQFTQPFRIILHRLTRE